MEITLVLLFLLSVIILVAFTSIRKGLEQHSDNSFIAEQTYIGVMHDFDVKHQTDNSPYPTTKGCKIIKTEDVVKFKPQSRLCNSSLV